jgi:hypothetical protein
MDNLFRQNQPSEPPPLIEVTITNRDLEPYNLQLLIQSNGGEIHSWNKYELRAATESESGKMSQSIGVGTGKMCLNDFLVSASIDGGDTWSQIGGQTFVENYDDISERKGAAAAGEVRDSELTFHPELKLILEGQCSNGTQESETTTDSAL